MVYYYVPSTYRGRRFGRGIRGCGYFTGGNLFNEAEYPVNPRELAEVAEPEEVEKIVKAEETGKPVQVKESTISLWDAIKTIGKAPFKGAKKLGKASWRLGKRIYRNPVGNFAIKAGLSYLGSKYAPIIMEKGIDYGTRAATKVGEYAYNKLDPHFGTYKNIADRGFLDNLKNIGTNAVGLVRNVAVAPFTGTRAAYRYVKGWFGQGYYGGRRGRFRKGSPEAKAYMAMLRSRRRNVGSSRRTKKKKGRGIIAMGYGGMFPKYGVKALETALTKARNNNTDVGIKMFKKKRVNMGYPLRDQYGDIVVDGNNNVVYRTRPAWTKNPNTGKKEYVYEPVLDDQGKQVEKFYPQAKIASMIRGAKKMQNFWEYENYDPTTDTWSNPRQNVKAFKKQYIAANRLGAKYKKYSRMSKKRIQRFVNQIRRRPTKYVDAYWRKRMGPGKYDIANRNFVNKWLAMTRKGPVLDPNDPSKILTKRETYSFGPFGDARRYYKQKYKSKDRWNAARDYNTPQIAFEVYAKGTRALLNKCERLSEKLIEGAPQTAEVVAAVQDAGDTIDSVTGMLEQASNRDQLVIAKQMLWPISHQLESLVKKHKL